MQISEEERARLQAVVLRLSEYLVFYRPGMSEQPLQCRLSIEAYLAELEAGLPAESELREKLLELLARWLHGNKDVKQIKVVAKNGRYRSFCEVLRTLRHNFRDMMADLCLQAGVDYPRPLRPD